MIAGRIADTVFDVAVVCTVVSVVALIWTLSLVAAQAVLTCGFVAGLALWAASLAEKQKARPTQPVVQRPEVRRDTVSEEEFDETMMPL